MTEATVRSMAGPIALSKGRYSLARDTPKGDEANAATPPSFVFGLASQGGVSFCHLSEALTVQHPGGSAADMADERLRTVSRSTSMVRHCDFRWDEVNAKEEASPAPARSGSLRCIMGMPNCLPSAGDEDGQTQKRLEKA